MRLYVEEVALTSRKPPDDSVSLGALIDSSVEAGHTATGPPTCEQTPCA